MRIPVIALRTNRIVIQAPGLQHVRVRIEPFELRSGPGVEPVVAGARGRVVGLVRDVRDVAKQSHSLDCQGAESGQLVDFNSRKGRGVGTY